MQQHPIPQNVTAYEFHLIGNMTLKQFIEVGLGVGVAVFFYATNLPVAVKWPLIFLSLGFGAALAFMPFDGRPLDKMIVAFFKAVYSPTQFVWRKTPQIPPFFSFKPRPVIGASKVELERQKVRKNIDEYLQTLPSTFESTDSSANNDVDSIELQFIANINQLFQTTPAANTVINTGETVTIKTSPKVRVRKLKEYDDISQNSKNITSTLAGTTITPNSPTPTPVEINSQPLTQPPDSVDAAQPLPSSTQTPDSSPVTPTTPATTNKQLPFPNLPTIPNILVGMVLDNQGKIIENAIIEVRDQNHMPIRALKTNRLGQFSTATPLKNGAYEIEIEKDGFQFDLIQLHLTGKIADPLEIRARA